MADRPIKIDFGRPNAEIGWKMASGRLLFLALIYNAVLEGVKYQFVVNFTKLYTSLSSYAKVRLQI